MKSERVKFCGETIEALERKVKERQRLVANRGSAPDDRDISKAILNLLNARDPAGRGGSIRSGGRGMKESTVEARLRKGVERAGGRCLKFVSPGHTGVPDRIILMPGGRVYFAELKAPGEKERPRQEYVQRKLAELGLKTYAAVDTFERVADVLSELVEEQKPARWIRTGASNVFGGIEVECSACKYRIMLSPERYEQRDEYERYCSHCGKPMRREEQDG